jgi:aminoglycoside phosphotransferase (APT) family kinase protein
VSEQGSISPEQAEQLLCAFRADLRLVGIWPLAGAVNSKVAGIEAERSDGRRCTLVLRLYGPAMVQAEPQIAQNEYELLNLLSAAGVPVPQPYLVDESSAIVPGSCILMEHIDGERVHQPDDLDSFLRQLAAVLAAVHACRIPRTEVPFLKDVRDYAAAEFDENVHIREDIVPETAIRKAVQANWPPPQVNEAVVLHNDYWPGNVLWREGRIVAVIDWEEAAFGDPMADLANIRLEIVWHFGPAAMNMLTGEYLAQRPSVGTATLPLWDLRTALRACQFPLETLPRPADEIASMRSAHRDFAVAALGEL